MTGSEKHLGSHIAHKIVRKTITHDEPYLRQVSRPVVKGDKELADNLRDLAQFCQYTECFALAAVQIGIPKRIVYLQNTTPDKDPAANEARIFINPTIISRKGHTRFWEACVSCLDYTGLVSRPYQMEIKYHDPDGGEHRELFKGFAATVLSHELDHLDGILHMDVAEEVKQMSRDERQVFRQTHPYEIISKTCDYDKVRKFPQRFSFTTK